MRYVLLSLLFALPASAGAAEAWQPLKSVQTAATEHVMRQAAPGTTATVSGLDARLRLPACTHALLPSTSSSSATATTVAVHCEAPVWTVYVPVRLSLRRQVVVLRQALARGQELSMTDVALEERDIGGASGYFSDPSQVAGKTLRRMVTPGAVLTPELLAAPLLIRRGELVTLLGQSGAMEVRVQAKALADGSAGQAIQVQNTSSGKIVGAVVKASGLVAVRL